MNCTSRRQILEITGRLADKIFSAITALKNAATDYKLMTYPIPDSLVDPMNRLKRITGFITTLHPQDDARPLFFGRYFHVERVAWIARWLANNYTNQGFAYDEKKVGWLVYAHDANRWPFAHNSEKNNSRPFIQSANSASFFSNLGDLRKDYLEDLQAIQDKNYLPLSDEGKIVLMADMITGFIEDPLNATICLDLNYKIVDSGFYDILHFPMQDQTFLQRLYDLNRRFFESRTAEQINNFTVDYNNLFQERAAHFIRSHKLDQGKVKFTPEFESTRLAVKERFLRAVLFPYNNEKVAHGSLIKRMLITPLKDEQLLHLTEPDEVEYMEHSIKEGLISKHEVSLFYPEIDYITKYESENSFRLNYFPT